MSNKNLPEIFETFTDARKKRFSYYERRKR